MIRKIEQMKLAISRKGKMESIGYKIEDPEISNEGSSNLTYV